MQRLVRRPSLPVARTGEKVREETARSVVLDEEGEYVPHAPDAFFDPTDLPVLTIFLGSGYESFGYRVSRRFSARDTRPASTNVQIA